MRLFFIYNIVSPILLFTGHGAPGPRLSRECHLAMSTRWSWLSCSAHFLSPVEFGLAVIGFSKDNNYETAWSLFGSCRLDFCPATANKLPWLELCSLRQHIISLATCFSASLFWIGLWSLELCTAQPPEAGCGCSNKGPRWRWKSGAIQIKPF